MIELRPPHGGIEPPGHIENAISDDLGLHATGIGSPDISVVRIGGHILRVVVGIHSIGCGGHQEPMDLSHGPAMLHKLGCKPVQEIRMSRRLAVLSEVEDVRYDRFAEVTEPDMVDGHAR